MIVLAALTLVAFPAPPAAADSGELVRLNLAAPLDIRAEKLTYDEKSDSYLAEGEVEITQGNYRLLADRVRLFAGPMTAEAQGAVRFTTPDQVLLGESMLVDMNKGTGKVYEGAVYVPSSHYYLRGKEIEKTGKDTYTMQEGTFTTCDGSSPSWEIYGKEVNVTLEGYGLAKDTQFRIREFPVMWSPYLLFPAKTKRESGFLLPMIGQSSRDGFVFSQPYFQVLGEEQDATITLNYMSRRGVDVGGEYRYMLNTESRGIFMADYLYNDQRAEDLYQDGDLTYPYGSRYWVRGKADQNLFGGDITLDLDWASDREYLREFTFGYTGYNQTNRRMVDFMGRDLDPNTYPYRKNQLNYNQISSGATFNATLLYTDNLLATDENTTLQKLPWLSYSTSRAMLGDTGVYFDLRSSYIYYYREQGGTGNISDIQPALSLPLNFNDYLELEPRFTWMERLYYADKLDETFDKNDPDKSGTSEQWQFKTDFSSYLYRVFDFGSADEPLKIKHALRPNITYIYMPNFEEEDIPVLAARRRQRVNTLSYGINNTFTSKNTVYDPETDEAVSDYREFLILEINHEIDITELQRDKPDGQRDNQPLGLVTGRAELDPSDNIYGEAEVSWNPNNNRWEQLYGRLEFSDYRGDAINLDYIFRDGSYKQMTSGLTVALTQEWSVSYANRHDFDNETDFETIYQLQYQSQCWGFRVFYQDDQYERGYYFAFTLGGFGELFGFSVGTRSEDATSTN
ncbi:MAG: LPS assembly protein LptD [Deltaproteobacteria bacterium]|nr:LPS assembly protein LptD [Deltaproteobacteria bacterium]